MHSDEDLTDVMQRYSDAVWRACMLYLKQRADAEDAFQDTFVKYARSDMEFASEEHRKAWLVRVAINTCKDVLKSASHRTDPVDSFDEGKRPLFTTDADSAEHSDLLDAIETLPDNQRVALYLTYREGYSAQEAADMLEIPVNTVYTNLARGRKRLKEVLTDGA